MASPSDIEKGLGGPSSAKSLVNGDERGPVRSELQVFQTLVGIHFLVEGGQSLPLEDRDEPPPNPLLDIFRPSHIRNLRYKNRGLYDRALSQELKNRSLYSMSSYIITGLYLLQIVLAATFTALSAYHHTSSIPLTTLGALNTVIAGLLAWLTGQGMPVRFRSARDQYRELVKAIEASERMFAEINYTQWPPGLRPNPIKERDRLEQMYNEALADQQSNYPGAHNTPTADKKTEQHKELQEKVEQHEAQRKTAKEKISSKKNDVIFPEEAEHRTLDRDLLPSSPEARES